MADERAEYVPITRVVSEGKSRLDIVWELLTSNMQWMQGNADRFAKSDRTSMTTLADSLTKTADQMLDLVKEEAGASGLSVEQIAKLMSGDYQPADEDQEQD